jgi:IS30 family transposase
MGHIYIRLTAEERTQLAALRKAQIPVSQIAKQLDRPPQTIYAEINRNAGRRGYRPAQAQRLAAERQANKPRSLKMSAVMRAYIDEMIREEHSPEQIAGAMKTDPKCPGPPVSHETIYKHIYADKAADGDLYTHLRQRHKKRKPRRDQPDRRGRIRNRVGIEEREVVVETRERIGDWEADLVCGAKSTGYLVTLVERKSRYTRIGFTKGKTAEEVTAEIVRLLTDEVVETITFDNGKEFAGHEQIARRLGCKCYFADPYSSWQRGLNENTNGLIRQYFPKGMSLKRVGWEQIWFVEARLNSRPRKCLDFKPPDVAYYSRAG